MGQMGKSNTGTAAAIFNSGVLRLIPSGVLKTVWWQSSSSTATEKSCSNLSTKVSVAGGGCLSIGTRTGLGVAISAGPVAHAGKTDHVRSSAVRNITS
jgi:hypothetical protein